jgi:ABC-type amino acid transport substrate-binding protein
MCTIIILDEAADKAIQPTNGNSVLRTDELTEAARLLAEKRADVAVMTTDTLQALIKYINSCALCGIAISKPDNGVTPGAELDRATQRLREIARSLQDARRNRQKQPA